MSNNFVYWYNIKNNSQPSKTTIKANNHPHKLHFHWIWNVKKNIYIFILFWFLLILELSNFFFTYQAKHFRSYSGSCFQIHLTFHFLETLVSKSQAPEMQVYGSNTLQLIIYVTVFFYNTMRYFVTLIQLSWEPYFELNSQIR